MKCLVLAGGKGDRLWPLSRKNYPKQFIQIRQNHSIFQETIARNIPFCDEFVIVTNMEYQYIIENQMKVFQGITYRCVYEEVARKTTAAIVLACMQFPMSEIMFVVASDHLVKGTTYKDDILHGKELVRNGSLVAFGMEINIPETRFGYIQFDKEQILAFKEKPDMETAVHYKNQKDYLLNSGMFLFRVGDLFQELRTYYPWIYNSCEAAYYMRKMSGIHTIYSEKVMEGIPAVPIEKTVFQHTKKAKVIKISFFWRDIGSLEDLAEVKFELDNTGDQVLFDCDQTTILNQCKKSVVVANRLQNTIIINTKDAVYVGENGSSDELKEIMRQNTQIQNYFDTGYLTYRKWGAYEVLTDESGYQVRKVIIQVGKTIYAHIHTMRNEHWTIVQGKAHILINDTKKDYSAGSSIDIAAGEIHQISNVGTQELVLIEVATGDEIQLEDMISIQSKDLSETELGYQLEPFVKMKPIFKDYLWGGTKLRDYYEKVCEYDTIAESWELSAHSAGQSVIGSGRHKGLLFGEYLQKIGITNLGWKCQSMNHFPLLIKLIDAKEDLSIQVHPSDEYALEHEKEYGKNELWYVLECEKGAGIYCGFKKDVTKDEVKQSIEQNSILELLNWIPVEKGSSYFIPTGTVHAIGKGILICEIQQSSNATYRLYDYKRKDKYGNERELHIEKALEVLSYKKYKEQKFEEEMIENEQYLCRVITRCKYFESKYYNMKEELTFETEEDSFYSIICIKGSGILREKDEILEFTAGDSIFLPMKKARRQIEGHCEILVTHV